MDDDSDKDYRDVDYHIDDMTDFMLVLEYSHDYINFNGDYYGGHIPCVHP